MSQIIITISPDGNYQIEAQGYTGSSCTEATASLERALGKAEKRDYKPEFHNAQTQDNHQHQ